MAFDSSELIVLETLAPSFPDAHGVLGRKLGPNIRQVAKSRAGAASAEALAAQRVQAGAAIAHLGRVAAGRGSPQAIRGAVEEYLGSLEAWADGAGLVAAAEGTGLAGWRPVEIALWLQDDNSGCVTGSLRRPDGGLVVWHTEEDTIGFFDAPRVWEVEAGGISRAAFLYPYLLPGPAFGWSPEQIQAIDSLHTRRPEGSCCPSSAASWVVWRLGIEVEAEQVVKALAPFSDGTAIHQFRRGREGAAPERSIIEFGGTVHAVRREEAAADPTFFLQANCVAASGAMREAEDLPPEDRELYVSRLARLAELLRPDLAHATGPRPDDALRWLCDTEVGGEYAMSNVDVKAYLVAELSADGSMRLFVGAGPAKPGHVFAPQWNYRGA